MQMFVTRRLCFSGTEEIIPATITSFWVSFLPCSPPSAEAARWPCNTLELRSRGAVVEGISLCTGAFLAHRVPELGRKTAYKNIVNAAMTRSSYSFSGFYIQLTLSKANLVMSTGASVQGAPHLSPDYQGAMLATTLIYTLFIVFKQ